MQIFTSLRDDQLVARLKSGAVGVVPSDTVYGLMCSAHDEAAVARLYQLKHREHKPGTLIAADIGQLVNLGIKRRYLTAVERFWPGPVSVVIPIGLELEYLHTGKQSLAMRIPDNDALRTLLQQTGPLLTSSANQPGEPPANNLAEAQAYFGDDVDFYVDGGDLSGRPPSTIIRVIDDAIEVVRQGTVHINEQGEIT